jgi:site-specific DNA-cytosine methylase
VTVVSYIKIVLATPKSTSTPVQVYNKQFNHKNYGDITKIDEKNYQTLTSLLEDFLVSHFQSLESEEDLMIQEARSSLTSLGLLGKNNHAFLLLENVKGLLSHDKGNIPYNHLHA